MIYVYFDESGDLGFDFSKQGTTELFTITFLIVKSRRPILSLVKKIYTALPPAIKRKNSGLLHASYEKPLTIKRLLSMLASKEIGVSAMHLDKRSIHMPVNPHELYTNMVVSLVNRLYADEILNDNECVNLIASRRNTSKSLNACFARNVVKGVASAKFSISIAKPADDKCLQAVDFVSWAFWQKYTRKNSTYTDLIADKVLYELAYLG